MFVIIEVSLISARSNAKNISVLKRNEVSCSTCNIHMCVLHVAVHICYRIKERKNKKYAYIFET